MRTYRPSFYISMLLLGLLFLLVITVKALSFPGSSHDLELAGASLIMIVILTCPNPLQKQSGSLSGTLTKPKHP
jgi:hypothetical protein